MNRYLDLLKRADQGGAGGGACVQERQMTNHQNLQNPVEGGFDGFVGRSDGTRAHSHPAASETPTDTAPPVRAPRWLIHFLDREPLEVWFSPAADHDEALAGYPDAVAAEPVPERTDTRTANVIERDENDQRKEPTNSERVALAQAITAHEKWLAEQRMKAGGQPCGNISTGSDTGKVRDIIAQKVGLGSGKTLEAAQKVIERGITVVLPVITKPTSITVATGCKSCRHRKRPGRSDPGYCGGGRDDLPGAYGLHHPLRKLPDDQGESCASYLPHEG